jgi:TldD protein
MTVPVVLCHCKHVSSTTSPPAAPRHKIDPQFTDLPLTALADAALAAAPQAGASYGLPVRGLMTADLTIRDTAVQSSADAVSTGYAVRVIVDGTWGFAASIVPTADEAAATARQAVAVARALAGVVAERFERADSRYTGMRCGSATIIDPFAVAAQDKSRCCGPVERLLASDGVAHTVAGLFQVKENKFYADTAGTTTTQQRVRLQPPVGHRGGFGHRRVRDVSSLSPRSVGATSTSRTPGISTARLRPWAGGWPRRSRPVSVNLAATTSSSIRRTFG